MQNPIILDFSVFPPWVALAISGLAIAAALVAIAALIMACHAYSTVKGIEKSRWNFVQAPENMTTVEQELSENEGPQFPTGTSFQRNSLLRKKNDAL